MKKRKTIWKAALLVTGIAFVMDSIKKHKKMRELSERITEIGHCHNDFCLMQGRINQSTEEQLAIIQEEIGSVYGGAVKGKRRWEVNHGVCTNPERLKESKNEGRF